MVEGSGEEPILSGGAGVGVGIREGASKGERTKAATGADGAGMEVASSSVL